MAYSTVSNPLKRKSSSVRLCFRFGQESCVAHRKPALSKHYLAQHFPGAHCCLYLSQYIASPLKANFYVLHSVMPSFDLSLRVENVGVIPPPPGVTPNFINPPSLQHIILITNIILSLVSAVFVILRLYTTGFIIRSVGIDDCKYFDLRINKYGAHF